MGKLTHSRHALVILILVLISQSFAVSAAICPMMMNMDSLSMDMSMDHTNHDMSQSQLNDQDSSCCDETNCKTMNCTASFLLPAGQVKSSSDNMFTLNELYRSFKLNDTPTTLYRPPII